MPIYVDFMSFTIFMTAKYTQNLESLLLYFIYYLVKIKINSTTNRVQIVNMCVLSPSQSNIEQN